MENDKCFTRLHGFNDKSIDPWNQSKLTLGTLHYSFALKDVAVCVSVCVRVRGVEQSN